MNKFIYTQQHDDKIQTEGLRALYLSYKSCQYFGKGDGDYLLIQLYLRQRVASLYYGGMDWGHERYWGEQAAVWESVSGSTSPKWRQMLRDIVVRINQNRLNWFVLRYRRMFDDLKRTSPCGLLSEKEFATVKERECLHISGLLFEGNTCRWGLGASLSRDEMKDMHIDVKCHIYGGYRRWIRFECAAYDDCLHPGMHTPWRGDLRSNAICMRGNDGVCWVI